MIRTRLVAVAAGVLASGTVMFAAAPAFATTPLTGCTPAASAPLYTTTWARSASRSRVPGRSTRP